MPMRRHHSGADEATADIACLRCAFVAALCGHRHGRRHPLRRIPQLQHPDLSELGARGAPTKQLVDPLFVLYDLLLIAFGVGVWMSPGGNRALRASAGLLIAIGAIGLPEPLLYPMNLRGSGTLRDDVPHLIVFSSVIVPLIIAAVTIGAFALGRRFRVFSYAILLTILVSGILTGIEAPGIVTGAPTRWIGLTERANVGAYLLWVAGLAISLVHSSGRITRNPSGIRLVASMTSLMSACSVQVGASRCLGSSQQASIVEPRARYGASS